MIIFNRLRRAAARLTLLALIQTLALPHAHAAPATPAEQLTVLPGFRAQLLHSATADEGSWICMTVDPKGRLIVSPQSDKQPLLRITLSSQGEVAKIELRRIEVSNSGFGGGLRG